MSERVSWITHKGKKILFVNASGLKDVEYLQVMDEVEAVYRTLPKKSTLILIDVTDSASTVETTEKQKALAEYHVGSHAAVVGVTGLKKVIAQAINREFHYASSVEEAKEWLASQ